jgi:hypothetical protein
VADTDRLVQYNLVSHTVTLLSDLDREAERLTDISLDENGHIYAPDFNRNRIYMLSEVSGMYSGLFVRINRIESNGYPLVYTDVTVEDRFGKPVVGLDESNFLIMEAGLTVPEFEVSWAGFEDSTSSIALIVDNRPEASVSLPRAREGVEQILRGREDGDSVVLYRTGNPPEILAESADSVIDVFPGLRNSVRSDWQPDTAIRLAATGFMTERSRKALVFLTAGGYMADDFERYDLLELADFMKNNGIVFYPVYLTETGSSEELNYLASETGGAPVSIQRPEGLAPIWGDLKADRSGQYTLTYESTAPTDFGRAYIPMSLEVTYIRKSGRDELGYFAPGDYR